MQKNADTQKRALGRGLSALIPQAAPAAPAPTAPSKAGVLKLAIESIHRDSLQPRRHFDESKLHELTESIKAQGLLQPILVRKDGDGYKIIAGERRWRASQAAGLKEIPAIVREVTEAQSFELALVENLQRADLNPIEEADGYKRLVEEFKLTQEQVAQRVGKERSTVANALRLLALPPDVKDMVADGSLSMGHARALLGVPRLPELQNLARQVTEKKLSVRDTERLVQQGRSTKKDAGKPAPKVSPQVKALTEELQRRLGTKVRLSEKSPGKGTLEVDFFSYDDLDRLLKLLRKE
ncbi:ParB/RepB/Spo0J family partition protein [Corallococcus sp. Z5C101001]|uniref:ParB/RepB/Spo0J family partition protein n=1 Tax=Corallococcus silvisoli TaxID=2697031 RepID=UPI00117EF104|nr:ParB/RepB/Spo0J family partition protein [Corallococcus silvisoli]NBD12812.1 ParB/RepB/Spo0J family partition protein [Corallococcus silvisoli]TSC23121.1 ParB/RepB/Spo0J family partition protein [Corallococcus sp. Z5C101001]